MQLKLHNLHLDSRTIHLAEAFLKAEVLKHGFLQAFGLRWGKAA